MKNYVTIKKKLFTGCIALLASVTALAQSIPPGDQQVSRQRILINENWKFFKYSNTEEPDQLIYDIRPEVKDTEDDKPADSKPTEAMETEVSGNVLKPWILPTGNSFIKDPAKKHIRPEGNPGSDFPFVRADFNDSAWENVNLPHDWAIKGPFYQGWDAKVGGGMGRLPSPGVAWYRKKLHIPGSDAGKRIFLDLDGAMSYTMVWLNGHLAGGWPYGYASWRVDLSPYIIPGKENQLAIRLDNPPHSSRWYPGGGIYRNVWLTKTDPVHVSQWGTFITSRDISGDSATIDMEISIDNDSRKEVHVKVLTEIFEIDPEGKKGEKAVAGFEPVKTQIPGGENVSIKSSSVISSPRLWGPPPTQTPNRYVALTKVFDNHRLVDQYETYFGIRALEFDPDKGILINDEPLYIKGVNLHHDLGALGAAFNLRAAERQLELLKEMGCNAIRLAHNQPAPEFLELTDRMGFLVVDEIFDVWERKKTPLDFHLIFPEWHEQDLRAFIRRDRNHPSIIMWSVGNEVGEQYTDDKGAMVAQRLYDMAKEEDPTRPVTASMNYAKPHMPFPGVFDIINLNYQGEGIRDAPAYEGLKGIHTSPQYPAFREKFPDKIILSSENAAALSSRGEYMFPVFKGISSPVKDGYGGDPESRHVSAYELYSVDFGSSSDKVFSSKDRHPFVSGGFVWSGWDYLGEPSPYYLSRSSYFGIIDLAGFKKDRYYLYQSRWRPELPMAHILPHWNWPHRIGEITPVHVFSSGDEAELFLNGESLGRKKKGPYEYRFRWDDVKYTPGELKVITYKDGETWAEDSIKTTGPPAKLTAWADRNTIAATNGKDLAYVTVSITDTNGLVSPKADNTMDFSIEGPGEIVATDNGDPTDLTPFPSHTRKAFNGLCSVIIRAIPKKEGTITLTIKSQSLQSTSVTIKSKG